MAFQLFGQGCTGNLGENIFTDGDFGAGPANIVPVDPQIAPGYLYETNPPPNDGYYTITNNIGQWSSNFGWMTIGDNSPNPNGYMMVVNASYDPGLFYEQEVTGLCENTLYEFSADVFNLIRAGSNLIKPNISFLIDGSIVYNSGDVPENEQWNTYGFTFTTLPNQTSVTLSLANNAPGGNGNDIGLDNISFRPCGPQALILPDSAVNICEDGAPLDLEATIIGNQYPTPNIQWQQSFDGGLTWVDIAGANGLIYTHSNFSGGTYYYRYLLANDPNNLLNSRCRVTSNIKIITVIPKFYTYTDTLCEGLTYPFANDTLTSTGIYFDSLTSVTGCDSIVTLNLTFVPNELSVTSSFTDPICSYTYDGTFEVTGLSNGTGPYSFVFDGRPAPIDSTIIKLSQGEYSFSVTDRYQCRFDSSVTLVSPPPFTIELNGGGEIELGDSAELTTTGNYPISQYIWSPDWVNCNTGCSPVEFFPQSTGYLTLSALSEEGCGAMDSVFYTVREVRNVFIPSAFTPNGDGLNDVFVVIGDTPSAQQVDQLLIFNRWGGVLFENSNFPLNDPAEGWDGTSRGKPIPEGVYPYVAKVRFLDQVVYTYSGTITVYR